MSKSNTVDTFLDTIKKTKLETLSCDKLVELYNESLKELNRIAIVVAQIKDFAERARGQIIEMSGVEIEEEEDIMEPTTKTVSKSKATRVNTSVATEDSGESEEEEVVEAPVSKKKTSAKKQVLEESEQVDVVEETVPKAKPRTTTKKPVPAATVDTTAAPKTTTKKTTSKTKQEVSEAIDLVEPTKKPTTKKVTKKESVQVEESNQESEKEEESVAQPKTVPKKTVTKTVSSKQPTASKETKGKK